MSARSVEDAATSSGTQAKSMTTGTDANADDIDELEAEIERLECRQRTEVLSPETERELVERIESKREVLRQKRRIASGDGPPIVRGQTVHIRSREPILVTRAGESRTYGAWDAENGEPVGEAWSLSEAAVRGLMRRYEWTRVDGEAMASVVGEGDESPRGADERE
ncbi:hypothetical protein NDI76_19165 [Halogeometricum sp. S1BR25-6]|uniref:Uncharacterized protein n=1 Tax=Halogeometricum salsisoli TaxID=2950536 RepID=A0ABU2GKR4_9EURY|nr:hypothetical protein [Halogeometricum sp. S1BR25-6]